MGRREGNGKDRRGTNWSLCWRSYVPSWKPITLATPMRVPLRFETHWATKLGRTQTVCDLIYQRKFNLISCMNYFQNPANQNLFEHTISFPSLNPPKLIHFTYIQRLNSSSTHLKPIPPRLATKLIDLFARRIQLQQRMIDRLREFQASDFRHGILLAAIDDNVLLDLCKDGDPFGVGAAGCHFDGVGGLGIWTGWGFWSSFLE